MSDTSPPLAEDLLSGARAIARFCGMTEREIYSAAERGELPIRRIAGKLRARKSLLIEAFNAPHGRERNGDTTTD